MDAEGKVALAMRPPTEEVVTEADLRALFETNSRPRHYIGLEVSGPLHLGSLVSTGHKINDLADAGVECTVFLADWHTAINDKLGGDMGRIARVAAYYEEAFRAVCPRARVVTGSRLYADRPEYWAEMVRFAGHMSLARTMRAMTIMGRAEGDERVDLGKLLYPAMQAVDIRFLGADIAHAGTDQRRIHMLAREAFPKMGWKAPVALHQRLLPGLGRPPPGGAAAKMSKSDPSSGVFLHDTAEQIRAKLSRAWCEAGAVGNNAPLEIARQVLFRGGAPLEVERPARFGGPASFAAYEELEAAFARRDLHPADLKRAVAEALVPIMGGIAARVRMDGAVREAMAGA